MSLRDPKWRAEAPAANAAQLLEGYYDRLLKWAMVVTRNEKGKAEEIVQEFCLYVTLAKLDFSAVKNLDGYFFISLRNLYRSSLARASREAMCSISVADFDTARFAIAAEPNGYLLDRQNDLRRICSYAVWRKDQSKSFSYFILHFFHGYHRSEVAEISGVPIAAIYNKLKAAREELKVHMEESGKLRIAGRGLPPEPKLRWQAIAAPEIFRELRQSILDAGTGACPSEEDLFAYYKEPARRPLPCALLSHIVSCERCLALVNGRFRRPDLKDREPLDIFNYTGESASRHGSGTGAFRNNARLRAVQPRWRDVYEHRPNSLSIAVNGRIVALHDIDGARSTLAARIEQPEADGFVEVFSDQNVRFALLPIGDGPPEEPDAAVQHVELSDGRWLDLKLAFDGQGLSSEVSYCDPILAMEAVDEEAPEESAVLALQSRRTDEPNQERNVARLKPRRLSIGSLLDRLRGLIPSSAMAWAFVLIAVVGGLSYMSYRRFHRPLSAVAVLHQSMQLEAAALKGGTEHQILQLQDITASGHIAQAGTIELWRDADGPRYLRRVYDANHHAVAAAWRSGNTEHLAYAKGQRAVWSGIPWEQAVSAQAFSEMGGRNLRGQAVDGNIQLTVDGPTANYPHLMSATLVLNRRLQPVREVLDFRDGHRAYRVRLLQTSFEILPSRSVPDSTFAPGDGFAALSGRLQGKGMIAPDGLGMFGQATRLAELEIGVLYQLEQMGVDANQPIAIEQTTDGYVRIVGAAANAAQQKQIVSRLESLPDHQLLRISLSAGQGANLRHLRSLRGTPGTLNIYEAASTTPPAYPLVRAYFARQHLSGAQLDAAVTGFSGKALDQAQQALQNAFALNRLGEILINTQVAQINPLSQREWTEMVVDHASKLGQRMLSLDNQLAQILPGAGQSPSGNVPRPEINTPVAFAHLTRRLLLRTQAMNRKMGMAFAVGGARISSKDVASLLLSIRKDLPLQGASDAASMANRLESSEQAAFAPKHGRRERAGAHSATR